VPVACELVSFNAVGANFLTGFIDWALVAFRGEAYAVAMFLFDGVDLLQRLDTVLVGPLFQLMHYRHN